MDVSNMKVYKVYLISTTITAVVRATDEDEAADVAESMFESINSNLTPPKSHIKTNDPQWKNGVKILLEDFYTEETS